ncbi:MAG: hypothetical protein WBB23_22600 [Desulforhopalus sp.]
MFPDNFSRVISDDGFAAIVSYENQEVTIVPTWNSNIFTTRDGRLLIPFGETRSTLGSVGNGLKILMTVGNKKVDGRNGIGCGFLINGTAKYLSPGLEMKMMEEKFPFLNCVLEVTVCSIKQTI